MLCSYRSCTNKATSASVILLLPLLPVLLLLLPPTPPSPVLAYRTNVRRRLFFHSGPRDSTPWNPWLAPINDPPVVPTFHTWTALPALSGKSSVRWPSPRASARWWTLNRSQEVRDVC